MVDKKRRTETTFLETLEAFKHLKIAYTATADTPVSRITILDSSIQKQLYSFYFDSTRELFLIEDAAETLKMYCDSFNIVCCTSEAIYLELFSGNRLIASLNIWYQ